MDDKQKWDGRLLQLAALVSSWSKDPSTAVGSVIANDKNQIISQGYNGLPRGAIDDERLYNREYKLARTLHAELNAVLNAPTGSTEGCTIYVTKPCCLSCCSVIAQAGIKRVVFVEPSEEFKNRWNFDESIEYLRELQINVSGYKQVD